MPEQINSTAATWRRTEDDAFANGRNGASSANATGTLTRSEDIGQASDSPAVDTTGSRTIVALLKGLFNRLPSTLSSNRLAVETLPTTLTTCTATTVAIAETSTQVLAANANRRHVLITNNGTNPATIVRAGTAVYGAGPIVLGTGGSYELEGRYKGVISAICQSGQTTSFGVEECV